MGICILTLTKFERMKLIPLFCCYLALLSLVKQSKGEDDRCCFQIGYGSRMAPCCLKTISCEEYDNLFEGYEKSEQMVGGAVGEHHYCPGSAEEAESLIAGLSDKMKLNESGSSADINKPWLILAF